MAKTPTQNKSLSGGVVRVRIRPLRGIGGYGNAGDEVMMPADEARAYQADGYVDILGEQPQEQPKEEVNDAPSD